MTTSDLMKLYEAAFLAGFKASAEAFNGEYMAGHTGPIEVNKEFREALEASIASDEVMRDLMDRVRRRAADI